MYGEWKHLVVTNAVTGVQAHDARLVAAMIVHGIGQLVTIQSELDRYKSDAGCGI